MEAPSGMLLVPQTKGPSPLTWWLQNQNRMAKAVRSMDTPLGIPGIRRVQLAGEFTCRRPGECWADGAIDMERVEDSHQQNEDPCAQGGPCLYQTYLEPNQYLRSERIYGYKLIETTQAGQSTWRMHPDASLHTMVDACLNSGLQPACDAVPN